MGGLGGWVGGLGGWVGTYVDCVVDVFAAQAALAFDDGRGEPGGLAVALFWRRRWVGGWAGE